jgi:hypothetical protein
MKKEIKIVKKLNAMFPVKDNISLEDVIQFKLEEFNDIEIKIFKKSLLSMSPLVTITETSIYKEQVTFLDNDGNWYFNAVHAIKNIQKDIKITSSGTTIGKALKKLNLSTNDVKYIIITSSNVVGSESITSFNRNNKLHVYVNRNEEKETIGINKYISDLIDKYILAVFQNK